MLSERETCRCQSCMRSDPFRNVSRLFYGVAEQQALGNGTDSESRSDQNIRHCRHSLFARDAVPGSLARKRVKRLTLAVDIVAQWRD